MNSEQEQPIPNPEQEAVKKEVDDSVYHILGAMSHEIAQKSFVVAGYIDITLRYSGKDGLLANNPALVERLKAAAKVGDAMYKTMHELNRGQIVADLMSRGITDKDAVLQAVAPPIAEKIAVQLREIKTLLADPSVRTLANAPAYWQEMIKEVDAGFAELELTLGRFSRAHKFVEKEFYGAHIYDSQAGAAVEDVA